MKHEEILQSLKRIPDFIKKFNELENSIAGAKAKKKELSKEKYQALLLKFDADEGMRGTRLQSKMIQAGYELQAAQPDFNLSYSKDALQRHLKTVGVGAVSERIKKQLELSELMEVKKQFQSINDFLDDAKIKALNTYLKGKK